MRTLKLEQVYADRVDVARNQVMQLMDLTYEDAGGTPRLVRADGSELRLSEVLAHDRRADGRVLVRGVLDGHDVGLVFHPSPNSVVARERQVPAERDAASRAFAERLADVLPDTVGLAFERVDAVWRGDAIHVEVTSPDGDVLPAGAALDRQPDEEALQRAIQQVLQELAGNERVGDAPAGGSGIPSSDSSTPDIAAIYERRGLRSLHKKLKAKEIIEALGLTPKKRGELQNWYFDLPSEWEEKVERSGRTVKHFLSSPGGDAMKTVVAEGAKGWRAVLEELCGPPKKKDGFLVYKIPRGGTFAVTTFRRATASGAPSWVIQTTVQL